MNVVLMVLWCVLIVVSYGISVKLLEKSKKL